MKTRTTEAQADADEQAAFAGLYESKSGRLPENSAAVGAAAPVQPADGDERGIAALTEQPSTEFKTYGPGEVTPLDELLRPAETTPAVDAAALADEVARRQAVVDRLETDVAKTRQRLSDLDGSRADVILNGGDLDALHSGLRDAEQMIKTLEAGLAPARAMLAKAQAAAGKAALERQAAAARDEHYGPAAEALQTMYKLLAGVCHSAMVLDEHTLAIEGMNQQALGNDRRDLVIDMDILRRAVLDTIGTQHVGVVVPVVRTGETDEAFEARLWSVVASNSGVAPNGKKSVARP
ncbi:hypothetical protein [Mesorhizobium huakuii]|uniref:Uncharacterized protein n=1 Tax=Mesorhizobium huakuii TaxID=28104 RepID=A0A7G6SMC6_9HYPH|nr:hypothetical protein [Mesorhizobium huakuii]QND55658.1 hypothetical protein HB778_02450 [Mesorhizobium huakuii]